MKKRWIAIGFIVLLACFFIADGLISRYQANLTAVSDEKFQSIVEKTDSVDVDMDNFIFELQELRDKEGLAIDSLEIELQKELRNKKVDMNKINDLENEIEKIKYRRETLDSIIYNTVTVDSTIVNIIKKDSTVYNVIEKDTVIYNPIHQDTVIQVVILDTLVIADPDQIKKIKKKFDY